MIWLDWSHVMTDRIFIAFFAVWLTLAGCQTPTTPQRAIAPTTSFVHDESELDRAFVEAYERAGRPMIAVIETPNPGAASITQPLFNRVSVALKHRIRQNGRVFLVAPHDIDADAYKVSLRYFAPAIYDTNSAIRLSADATRYNNWITNAEVDLSTTADEVTVRRAADSLTEKLMNELTTLWNSANAKGGEPQSK